ncbi:hypothetical protein BV898_11938 [Hypsibius exemplaris]|uniref:NodB homology domain-containing protein n=1 Tax=Hypsibius exemplaris TaxID=2072580 RepID=A0A1W0WF54_HYPEX|nr:hypothetical protein BV898_11938 [Hypsibius exemplaris]
MVRYLYEKGHEIASHSITHGVGTGFKRRKSLGDGNESPCTLLGPGGDDQFEALLNGGFLYDSTLVTPTSFKSSLLAIHDGLRNDIPARFLDVVGAMPDVWIVTGSQAVAWMQQPTPVSQLPTFAPWLCSADDASRLPQCDTINACPLPFRDRLRYFYTCSECPAEFPWRPEQ